MWENLRDLPHFTALRHRLSYFEFKFAGFGHHGLLSVILHQFTPYLASPRPENTASFHFFPYGYSHDKPTRLERNVDSMHLARAHSLDGPSQRRGRVKKKNTSEPKNTVT
jgi:hypothetical protein